MSSDDVEDVREFHRRITRAIVVPQVMIWALIAFVPVTLHGGPGMDVGYALLLMLFSALLALVALVSAFRSGYFAAFALQLSLPAAVIAGHYLVGELRTPPTRDAAEYQHLVGWSREQVEEEFGTYGMQTTHYQRSGQPPVILLYYPGLEIEVSEADVVVAVRER
ncbi:MAG: hypothetical protein H6831_14030 [Planctomycetes bacterium]|nr:hypothetical protein [Planctomycetota bacterium]MCB9905519.1 hypothetical protein [Planctomycetota bacterium]